MVLSSRRAPTHPKENLERLGYIPKSKALCQFFVYIALVGINKGVKRDHGHLEVLHRIG
jgi:hypothetical protein